MADLGNVLSAATQYGNDREAEGVAEERERSAAELAEANARLLAAEAETSRVTAELLAVVAEFEEHMETVHGDPDPDPDPTFDLLDTIHGTWVLQQVSTADELNRLRPQIDAALALEGVVGLSVRYPWNRGDITGTATSNPILDLGLKIANDAGKQFALRFMAGRHTPARVFDAGAAFLTFNSQKAPVPWDNTSGTVQVFLDAYDEYAGRLADWCRANDVHLLHGSWFALDWAELNHGKEIRAVSGYTEAKWLAGHKALITVLAKHASDDLAVELPMSGYGPLSGGQSAALVDHVISLAGENSPQFIIQANGWGPNGEWGAPSQTVENDFDRIWSKPVIRALQMIQPQDYDWTVVYNRLDAPVNGVYAEVYLPSFNLTNRTQLRNEIAAYAPEEN